MFEKFLALSPNGKAVGFDPTTTGSNPVRAVHSKAMAFSRSGACINSVLSYRRIQQIFLASVFYGFLLRKNSSSNFVRMV